MTKKEFRVISNWAKNQTNPIKGVVRVFNPERESLNNTWRYDPYYDVTIIFDLDNISIKESQFQVKKPRLLCIQRKYIHSIFIYEYYLYKIERIKKKKGEES